MAQRFVFRLETLLRVRALREREAQRNLAAKSAEIARVDRLNEESLGAIRQQQADLLAAQQRGRLDSAALQRGRAWIAHLRRTITLRTAQRGELTAQLEHLRAAYAEAHKQTRILEKLRERRWTEHVRATERAEQAAADELAQQMPNVGQSWVPAVRQGSA